MAKPFRSLYFFLSAFIVLVLPIIAAAFFSVDSIVSTPLKKIVFILFGLSFYFILLSLIRPKYFLFVLLPIALASLVEIYLVLTLKSAINEGIMSSFFNTNYSEVIGVLSANVFYIILAVGLFLGYFYLSKKVAVTFVFSKKIRIVFFLFFFLIQGLIISRDIYVAKRLSQFGSIYETVIYSYRVKALKTFPVNWILHYRNYGIKSKQLQNYNERVKSFKFGASEVEPVDEQKVMVLVIGETARRHNLSLYGYHRKTNPLLEMEPNLIVMNNAESVYNLTSFAFPVFITRATSENFEIHLKEKSVMSAFQEAGFYTIYINNQPLGHGSIYHTYASQSDTLIDLATSLDTYSTDEIILPEFDKLYQKLRHKKTLIVIHSLGSHFRYNFRYPASYEIYKPAINSQFDIAAISRNKKEELVNSYDNSILFTDYFLSGLISVMKADSSMVGLLMYASDHGENLFDDENYGFAHGGSVMSKYEKEIPLLIWCSERYENVYGYKIQNVKSNINAPVNTNHFFHSILDLSGIYINEETLENSFASKKFKSLPH